MSASNGRGGTSVSEVKAYDIGLLTREIPNGAIAVRHEPVGNAVETIPANPVTQVEVIWNRVQIGALRQGVVKRRIKYRDLRNLRAQQFAYRANSPKIRGIVQGSEVDAILDSRYHFVGDQDGIRKRFAAVHHSMSDRVDVSHALDF
jgi:hypothetical protein